MTLVFSAMADEGLGGPDWICKKEQAMVGQLGHRRLPRLDLTPTFFLSSLPSHVLRGDMFSKE